MVIVWRKYSLSINVFDIFVSTIYFLQKAHFVKNVSSWKSKVLNTEAYLPEFPRVSDHFQHGVGEKVSLLRGAVSFFFSFIYPSLDVLNWRCVPKGGNIVCSLKDFYIAGIQFGLI